MPAQQVTTTPIIVTQPAEPISFILSFPASNTDLVNVAFASQDFQSEKLIQCFPASKLIVRNFKGRVMASANSGTQSYYLLPFFTGQDPFEYVSDIAGLVLVASPRGAQAGSANSANTVLINVGMAGELALIISSSGGDFAGQSATVSVSVDGVNFIQVDTITLTTGQSTIAKQYDATHLAAGLAVNPSAFPFIRITVPALGAGISSTVTWAGKLA